MGQVFFGVQFMTEPRVVVNLNNQPGNTAHNPPPLPPHHTHTHTHTHTHRAVGGLEEWEGADYESTSDRVPRMGIFT